MSAKNSIISLLKHICFLVLAVALVFGTFYYENKQTEGVTTLHAFSAFDYKNENVITNNGVIRFDQSSNLKPDVSVKQIDGSNEYIFEVKSGHFWCDFSYSDSNVNFLVGNVVVIPYNASFDIQFDGNKLSITVFQGDVYLGFLDKGISLVKYENPYSGAFMNRFLIPLNNGVEFGVSRIDETFKLLLPSKVAKEIKYRPFSSNPKEASYAKNYTDFVKQNLRDDRRRRASLSGEYKTELIDKGISVHEGIWGNLSSAIKDGLTFIPAKKEERNFEKMFGYLNDALFYAAKGDTTNSGISLNKFKENFGQMTEVFGNEDYEKIMNEYISKLFLTRDAMEFSPILIALMENKMSGNEAFHAMDVFWFSVYEGLESGDSFALAALSSYFDRLSAFIGGVQDKELLKKYLAYQNQLINNLFLKFPVFFKDDYFQKKEELEQRFLDLFETGQVKDEWMLSLIKDKIDVLVKLQRYFFEGSVDINETRKIVLRLKDSIQNLMAKSSTELAVLQIFEKNINEISSFGGFLNSPEYYASNSYGSDYKERYDFYLKERTQIWNFIEIGSGAGDTGTTSGSGKTVMDLKNSITAVFEADQDVTSLEIGEIKDVNQVEVDVKFIMKGYPVEATYDLNKGTLKNVYIYGEVITESDTKLKGLSSLIDKKFAAFTSPGDDDDQTPDEQETNAQIILKRYLANQMVEAGFDATAENIKIIDEFAAVYKVESVHVKGNESVEVTFDYDAKTELATKIYLILEADVNEIEGPMSLTDVKAEAEKMASQGQNPSE